MKLAVDKATEAEYACKIMALPQPGETPGENENTREDIFKEIDILCSLNHDNVVFLKEYFEDGNKVGGDGSAAACWSRSLVESTNGPVGMSHAIASDPDAVDTTTVTKHGIMASFNPICWASVGHPVHRCPARNAAASDHLCMCSRRCT